MNVVEGEYGELEIRDVDYGFFKKTLETLPEEPEFSELIFLAEGIIPPDHNDENDRIRYLEECKEKGVIPTTIEFEWNQERNFFVPEERQRGYSLGIVDSAERDMMFHGGRNYRLTFKTNRGTFGNFMDDEFDKLSKEGYQLVSGDLALTTYDLTGYNQGTYAGMQLLLRSFRGNDLNRELTLKNHAGGEKIREEGFREWFRGLVA